MEQENKNRNKEFIFYKSDNVECILAKYDYNDFIRNQYKNKTNISLSENNLHLIRKNLINNVNNFCKK